MSFPLKPFKQSPKFTRINRALEESCPLGAALTGLPEDVALLRVAVELLGKLVGLVEAVEQEEELIAAQVNVHAVFVVKELLVHERVRGNVARNRR